MQLYAIDNNESLVFAGSADRKKDYFCLECSSIVRLRGGIHRQNHFYHIQTERHCRQNGKGMEHIQLQIFLYDLLPPGDCELEKKFQEIGRIADVIWLSEKIVFEIQCSPIYAEEVRARNQDYACLGFSVVWILHDKQFNSRKVSAVEQYLSPSCHYFTNMDREGKGMIYDQFDVVHRGLRIYTSPPFPVALQFPKRKQAVFGKIPYRLKKRMEQAKLFFSGDLQEFVMHDSLFIKALEKEQCAVSKISWKLRLVDWISRPYHIIFRYLLEKASR